MRGSRLCSDERAPSWMAGIGRGAHAVVALLRGVRTGPALHGIAAQLLRDEPAPPRSDALGRTLELRAGSLLPGLLARAPHDVDLRARHPAGHPHARLRRRGPPEPPPSWGES